MSQYTVATVPYRRVIHESNFFEKSFEVLDSDVVRVMIRLNNDVGFSFLDEEDDALVGSNGMSPSSICTFMFEKKTIRGKDYGNIMMVM